VSISDQGRNDVLRRLDKQALLTSEYSEFGLISELQVSDLANTLKTIPLDRLDMVIQVLEPFLRGNEARLDALKPLHIALTTLVESINTLYLNKRITLHIEKGLRIATLTGEQLLPDQLSSGEQELLILFCEVISALGPNTILLIDEPELSLNVSWQKNLLDALLRCASGNNVQFVIATHSIELLTRHRRNVARLSNKIVGPPHPTTDPEKVEA
jgi:ABC-type microcin C transport system duplicated ATPase subunit YejF